ncbi:MAG TPA: carboxypeptidase regulatory-like domain-containing protein [Vicinamibacterales bacterium]|nr:carboxypeptidase regulatory-like domain-containing protein [Vicinamibacterales bacterium]
MSRSIRSTILATLGLLLSAASLHAQTIAGVVRDDSGAVMPGVTVEASSPALIEKTRSAVTDGTGQYKIVNLSPGTYTVVFSLTGFSSVKRENIQLSTDFTASINAQLKVGSLEETITVSGASPLVDVQSTTKQTVLTREVLDGLPTPRSIQAAGVLIPGVTMSATVGGGRDVGGSTKLQQPGLTFHGNGQTIQRWDGFWLSNVQGTGTGGATSFYVNDSGAQELVYSTGAEAMDMATAGLYVNMIPKDGGNRFSGVLFADFTKSGWQSDNLTDALKSRGLTNVSKIKHISDFNPGIGGPIRKDSIWFYAAYRYEAIDQTVVDSYYDKNPSPYLYEADLSQPGRDNGKIPNQSVRVTWQFSSKDKVQGWFTNQNKYRSHYNISASRTPDATSLQNTPYAQAMTLKWTRTQTSRLLLEGGVARGRTLYQELYQPNVIGDPSKSTDKAFVQALKTYSITDQANGKVFGAYDNGYSGHGGNMENGRLQATYVTGSHEVKGGVMLGHGMSPSPTWWSGDITMTFNAGLPQSVTMRIPSETRNGYFPDLGIYAQDRWRFRRATLTGGLRYDYYVGRVLDGTLPSSRWNPDRFFPGFTVQKWKDFSPRVGVAYDLFGNGKTALKWNIARYVAADGVSTAAANNPQTTVGRTDTRTWTDTNGDFTIYNTDGSLQANELGPTTNVNFGKVVPSTNTQDPATLNGFDSRGSSIEWQAVVQHALLPRVALTADYYFRYNGNQTVTDNTLLTAADYDGPFCVTAPMNKDLPNGGGYQVCGLYDVKVASRSLQQNNTTFARNFGGIVDHYMGFDLTMSARLSGGGTIQGGLNAQKRVYDTCNASILSGTTVSQADSPEKPFCHQELPYRPDFKMLAAYNLPLNFSISGTVQVSSGPMIIATWAAPNSLIAPALGRNLAAGATATKSIQLIEPGTLYAGYQNQIDLRLSRRMRIGRYSARLDANVYNVLNNAYANSINTTFSTSAASQFMRPTAVLAGRLFKIGGQIEF